MGNPKVFASEVLALVARRAAIVLHRHAVQNVSASAAAIAGRLLYIADELSNHEPNQLQSDMQSLSLQALQDLVDICNWPTPLTPGHHYHFEKSPQELRDLLAQAFRTEKLVKSIDKFCREKPHTIEPLKSRFTMLAQTLQGKETEIAAYSQFRPLAENVYPDEVNKLLFDGVTTSASCVQKCHGTSLDNDMHLTKLCLNSGFRWENQGALFNIITAASKMEYWQELAISVPIKDIEGKDAQDLKKCKGISFDACKRLEDPSYAKIYLDLDENCKIYERSDPEQLQHIITGCGVQLSELLIHFELTVEHKIKLSYAIARAFWQFYSSELMNARWMSEDILFIPIDRTRSGLEGIPLRAFVSFPFGTQYKKSPAEFCETDQFTHRYPRILYLGIVLLEIGLGEPIRLVQDSELAQDSEPRLLAHTNTAHVKARTRLKELKKAKWEGFPWKDYFVEAVENCLDSNNFKETPKSWKSRRRRDPNESDNTVSFSPLSERRDALYRNVVAPLFWLATVGFEDKEEMPVVPLPKKPWRKSTSADNEEIQSFGNWIRENPSFHSGSRSGTPRFLEDLQVIAAYISRCRRKVKVTIPIRVAILDTGCQRDLAFFQELQRSERLKGWKDFTSARSESEMDTFGHGTFMARLLMHVAPIVDVYLIRVAENSRDLENNQESIARAIEHAGLDPDWRVNVVSMSFGFPNKPGKTYPVISDSIKKVREERKGSVLFLASAGNSWEGKRDFPASHQDVIPIYAGNSKGGFLESTPKQTGKEPTKLGTYGSDIPPAITEEVRVLFPKADLSAGTSIATAIAAGIVAMTLSHIAALPLMFKVPGIEQLCAQLYEKKGMEQMLYNMSLRTNCGNQFINPVWFWGQKQEHCDFFVSLCSAIERMKEKE